MTTRLAVGSRLRIYIEPRDVWVGVYVARDAVYVCPLPTAVFRWRRRMTDDPIVITRDELLTVWRETHPGQCSCPSGEVDPSCPQHSRADGGHPMTDVAAACAELATLWAALPDALARDIHSGAGNCICGRALGEAKHVAAAPGVPIPERMRP